MTHEGPSEESWFEAAGSGLPEAFRRPFSQLMKELRARPQQWGLFILQFDHQDDRRQLIRTIAQVVRRADTLDVRDLDWTAFESGLVRAAANGAGLIQVTGMERWLDTLERGQTVSRLRAWNIRREAFARAIPVPVLCWMQQEQIGLMATLAPDLWSWRRSVHRFVRDEGVATGRPAYGQSSSASGDVDGRTVARLNDRLRELEDFDANLGAEESPRMTAALASERAEVLDTLGRHAEALALRRGEIIPALQRQGDLDEEALTWSRIAQGLVVLGKLDEALDVRRERELSLRERQGHPGATAATLGGIADILARQGDFDSALGMILKQELPIYQSLADERGAAHALSRYAELLVAVHREEEALTVLRRQVFPTLQRLDDRRGVASTLGRIADILAGTGRLDEALHLRLRDQLPLLASIRDDRALAHALDRVASIYEARGDHDSALQHLNRQRSIFRRLGDETAETSTQRRMQSLEAARDRSADA